MYNNGGSGLNVFQLDESNGQVLIQDVSSYNNLDHGIQLAGTHITLHNAETIKNGDGIAIVGHPSANIVNGSYAFNFDARADIKLEGMISSYDNYRSGLLIDNFHTVVKGSVSVSAEIETYNNGLYGVEIENNTHVDVVLENDGSIAACNNGNGIADTDDRIDILNDGYGIIIKGSGRYICEYTEGYGDLPDCQPCSTYYEEESTVPIEIQGTMTPKSPF